MHDEEHGTVEPAADGLALAEHDELPAAQRRLDVDLTAQIGLRTELRRSPEQLHDDSCVQRFPLRIRRLFDLESRSIDLSELARLGREGSCGDHAKRQVAVK